jgi:hypothetical protein
MKTRALVSLISLLSLTCNVYAQQFEPEKHKLIQTDREDGRYVSSRGFVHALLKNMTPEYAFDENFTKEEMLVWQTKMQDSMKELMKHPALQNLPVPQMVDEVQRDGYRVQKWEAYPLPECVVPYLVLIPDTIAANEKVPAVLCLPGKGKSKESAAGEPELHAAYGPSVTEERFVMALPFVRKGMIAVVVDNPGTAETSDLERYARTGYQYDQIARVLLELDWSYLGFSSYCSMHVLNWMKQHRNIRQDRLIACGFSLGTGPMMALGLMDTSIYAFVYNDFLCNTLERWLVLTEPNQRGIRNTPNTIMHLIPGFLKKFDFPDIVAAFAPRPVIFTEGGLDRDFHKVKKAYEIMGASENMEYHHYPKFENAMRTDLKSLPEGLNAETYLELSNVDPPAHDMKMHQILPWLDRILK